MKKFLFIVLILIIGFTFILKNNNSTTEARDSGVDAKAIILIDAETGKVLYEENSTESLPIASMSKMMTQYLVLNVIQSGSLSWDSEYSPSGYVREMTSESAVVRLGMLKRPYIYCERAFYGYDRDLCERRGNCAC